MAHRATHTGFKRGKRIYIVYRDKDKEPEIDKFVGRSRNCVIFERLGKIPIKDISSLGIYKGNEKSS